MTKEELKKKKVSAIILGCDKNRVDLEKMLFLLKDYGFTITENVEESDIVIIQTCAFILPARKEAIDNTLYALNLKKQNKIEKVIVSGCLPQKCLSELQDSLPEVDAFVLMKSYSSIVNIIEQIYDLPLTKTAESYSRVQTTPNHYSYLKIADGCDNCCSYCTIPRIRGRYQSIPMNILLKETKEMVKNGVKELIIVAQDVTKYGEDIYGENKLIELLEQLSLIKDLKWIRLLYCYPEKVTDNLLNFIVSNNKMCKYIDIPLQHIDNDILKHMNRRSTESDVRNLISKIKANYPTIAIRTTFIVGFPGETSKQYNKLVDFVKKAELDNVGFFTYSREENTKSFYMRNQIPSFIKKLRLKHIQKVQNNINLKVAKKYIGEIKSVIIDKFDSDLGVYYGRMETFSPDIDFNVIVEDNNNVVLGEIYSVKIYDYYKYNYRGEII